MSPKPTNRFINHYLSQRIIGVLFNMEENTEKKEENPRDIKLDKEKVSILKSLKSFYDSQYKLLLIIPFLLLVFSLVSLGAKYASTGDFINRDVSLKGGVTITITTDQSIDIDSLRDYIALEFPENGIEVRSLTRLGKQAGVIIVADISEEEVEEKLDPLLESAENLIGITLTKENYSVEIVGSSLGISFFREVMRSLLVAFCFMGAVVFLYFGPDIKLKVITFILAILTSSLIFMNAGIVTDIIALLIGLGMLYIFLRWSIPSFAVILAALSDIIVTLAIVNITGMKLSSAGIAAFLMLIGYSVDTDILLSTRVLKRKEGTVLERIFSAAKTGFTMTLTTLAALSVAMIFTDSLVIRQIMEILLIGLGVDIINTWIQNVGVLRLYLEKARKR